MLNLKILQPGNVRNEKQVLSSCDLEIGQVASFVSMRNPEKGKLRESHAFGAH
jgi:hypothetical protein